MAQIYMCATEKLPQVVPLVAYMNICANQVIDKFARSFRSIDKFANDLLIIQEASLLNSRSTKNMRYRAYMHELIHILGFTEDSMNSSGILHDVTGSPGNLHGISKMFANQISKLFANF